MPRAAASRPLHVDLVDVCPLVGCEGCVGCVGCEGGVGGVGGVVRGLASEPILAAIWASRLVESSPCLHSPVLDWFNFAARSGVDRVIGVPGVPRLALRQRFGRGGVSDKLLRRDDESTRASSKGGISVSGSSAKHLPPSDRGVSPSGGARTFRGTMSTLPARWPPSGSPWITIIVLSLRRFQQGSLVSGSDETMTELTLSSRVLFLVSSTDTHEMRGGPSLTVDVWISFKAAKYRLGGSDRPRRNRVATVHVPSVTAKLSEHAESGRVSHIKSTTC